MNVKNNSKLCIIAIKINFAFNFENHLHLLDDKAINNINKYKFRKDKLIAFASYMLKYYYLARYMDICPNNMQIKLSKNGKPFLDNNTQSIDFNITHSGQYVIMAIVHNALIGVDIELIKPDLKINELSPIVFSQYECNLINNNTQNFFLLWTKKEALIKAIGIGFNDSNFYKNTALNLQDMQIIENNTIYSQHFDEQYIISICLSKKA